MPWLRSRAPWTVSKEQKSQLRTTCPLTRGRGSLTYRARVLRDRRQRLALTSLVGPAGTPAIDDQASVAQLVEPLICNQEVMGSSPIAGSIYFG